MRAHFPAAIVTEIIRLSAYHAAAWVRDADREASAARCASRYPLATQSRCAPGLCATAAQFTAQLQGNVWEVGLGIGRIILVGLDKRLDVSVEPVKA